MSVLLPRLEAARRRQAEARRPDEGEKLEEIERREGGNAEAPRRRPAVAEIGRFAPCPSRRLGEAEQLVANLRGRGIRCVLRVYEDEGHGLSRLVNRLDAYPRAVAFLDDVLGR